ncbi:MAG: hypothetical protein NTX66_01660, partial [Candidatus Falkowbacteria bacterium]|nr:hypothetical protein [Candidatus Falkowbacteria bacterium]
GCLIDFDHVLEYFFVYGLNFNLLNFLAGKQFLRSDKIYIVFHAWEWLVVLSGLVYLLRKRRLIKIFLVTLILAMFIHLISDVFINRFPIKFYSISYRYVHNFSAPELLSPEQWAKNLELKKTLSF